MATDNTKIFDFFYNSGSRTITDHNGNTVTDRSARAIIQAGHMRDGNCSMYRLIGLDFDHDKLAAYYDDIDNIGKTIRGEHEIN